RTMGDRIFVQKLAPLLESISDVSVDGDITERCFPGAFAHDRQGATHPRVVRTHHDTDLRNFHRREYRARHVAGVNVACVGNDTADSAHRLPRRNLKEIEVNFLAQDRWITRIETAGDSRVAKHSRGHKVPPRAECRKESNYRLHATSRRGSGARHETAPHFLPGLGFQRERQVLFEPSLAQPEDTARDRQTSSYSTESCASGRTKVLRSR